MNKALTIEQFNTLLKSEKDTSPLMAALRKIMSLKEPEKILVLRFALDDWSGWN
ncbi:MAG: hypothetical protein HY326_07745 [Chloroflexi bacterium]|nr:hypothetical protein [Chloroflexota bacterium]